MQAAEQGGDVQLFGHGAGQLVVAGVVGHVAAPPAGKHAGVRSARAISNDKRLERRRSSPHRIHKISHQQAVQKAAQAGGLGSSGRNGSYGIAKLLLGQRPESGLQLVAGHLGPGPGRGVQVGPVCGQGGKHLQKNAGSIGGVGPGQHREHLAVQICGSVLRIHPALETLHPFLGAQELGPKLQMGAQRVAGQAQLVELNRRCIGAERFAAQASVQQPVGNRLGHRCRAVQQPVGGGGSFQLPLHFEQRNLIQSKHGDVVQRQAVHILGELAIGIVPENQVMAIGKQAGQGGEKSGWGWGHVCGEYIGCIGSTSS